MRHQPAPASAPQCCCCYCCCRAVQQRGPSIVVATPRDQRCICWCRRRRLLVTWLVQQSIPRAKPFKLTAACLFKTSSTDKMSACHESCHRYIYCMKDFLSNLKIIKTAPFDELIQTFKRMGKLDMFDIVFVVYFNCKHVMKCYQVASVYHNIHNYS